MLAELVLYHRVVLVVLDPHKRCLDLLDGDYQAGKVTPVPDADHLREADLHHGDDPEEGVDVLNAFFVFGGVFEELSNVAPEVVVFKIIGEVVELLFPKDSTF